MRETMVKNLEEKRDAVKALIKHAKNDKEKTEHYETFQRITASLKYVPLNEIPGLKLVDEGEHENE